MLILTVLFIIFITSILIYNYRQSNKNYNYLLEKPTNYKFNKDFVDLIKEDEKLVRCIDQFCSEHDIYKTGTIISLSGGVDSMVVLAILLFLQTKHNFKIYTASIDYGLRSESKYESEFLDKYTKMFGIKSYISFVKGVSRKKNDSGKRSEFEEESRHIRFNTYKKIIAENDLPKDCGVFVAHHQDDIVENIFTNSMKGANLLDLEVMKPISVIHDVSILRPLLEFKKQVIYDFAHQYNIPYFLDTTPEWSRRGRMRNVIFPLLDAVFSPDWRNQLKLLGTQSNEWGEYFNTYILNPWLSEVKKGSHGIIIPIKSQPKLIYSNLILKSLHQIGENMIKRNSVDTIMETILKGKQNKIITLDNHRMAYLCNNELIIINIKKTYKIDNSTDNIYEMLINGHLNPDKLQNNLVKLLI